MDNSFLWHLDGVAQGTSDGVGAVARIEAVGTALTVLASAGPAGSGNGDDLVNYSLAPVVDIATDLPGTSYAVAADVSPTHAYIAQYADNSGTAGQFVVVNLTTRATGTVFSGVTGVRAVGVANWLTPKLIFVAATESGAERLRVYQENGLTPTLLLNTKLTSRANALTVAEEAGNPNGALLYVSLTDRLNIYRYISASDPVQLVDSLTLPGGGSFFRSKVATNGNVFVAAGNAGLLCLSPDGKILAQVSLSGQVVSEWRPSTVYTLNALVRPRESHQFAKSRYYFRCTSVGSGSATSGSGEPSWASTGITYDPISPPTAGNANSLQWTPVGLTDGVAVDLALDETAKRVYVVGNAGGNLGTDGRVWLVTATGLL
jgi:hypothetical protein